MNVYVYTINVVCLLLFVYRTLILYPIQRNGLILRTEGKTVISKVGMTVSFLFIAIFVAQFLLGVSLGNLIQFFGTSKVIIVVMLASQLMGTIFLVCNLNKFSET